MTKAAFAWLLPLLLGVEAAHPRRVRSSEVREVTPRSWPREVESLGGGHDFAILFYARSRRAVSWWTRLAERVPPKRQVLFLQFDAHRYDPPTRFAALLQLEGAGGAEGGGHLPALVFVPRGGMRPPYRFDGTADPSGGGFSFTRVLSWVLSANAAAVQGRFSPRFEGKLGEPDPAAALRGGGDGAGGGGAGAVEEAGKAAVGQRRRGARVSDGVSDTITALSKQRLRFLQGQRQRQQAAEEHGGEDVTALSFFYLSAVLLALLALFVLRDGRRRHPHEV